MSDEESLRERTYERLKADVSGGTLSSLARLDFSDLAHIYATSTTPVREAAMRLLGEGLLEPHPKGGLRPVYTREADLVALLDLHERLVMLALRWPRRRLVAISSAKISDTAGRARLLFSAIGRAAGNEPFASMMGQLDDRLERFWRIEERFLVDIKGEFAAIEAAVSSPDLFRRLLRRYYQRRRAIAARCALASTAGDADTAASIHAVS